MEKIGSSRLAAMGLLSGIILFDGIGIALIMARPPGLPSIPFFVTEVLATVMAFGLVSLVLLWGRNRMGNVGALIVGIFGAIWHGIGLALVEPSVFPVAAIVLSVLLIGTSAAALREKL